MKSSNGLPVGSVVRIDKAELQQVVDKLRQLGYVTIGPKLIDSAVVLGEIDSIDQFPIGFVDEQDGGKYQVVDSESECYFDYAVGPHSMKNYLFPSRETLLESHKQGETWEMQTPEQGVEPIAVFGIRACDLHALVIQDRVFLGGTYVDVSYQTRRHRLFVVAVNCQRAAPTCFCHSMQCGPTIKEGFDLAFTELEECFIVEVGTEKGSSVLAAARWSACSVEQLEYAQSLPTQLAEQMSQRGQQGNFSQERIVPHERSLDTTDLRELLLNNLEHPRWEHVAKRCLSCANCTMVCPTCFCASVDEVSDLSGDHVRRERTWGSCFNAEHSYMNTGTVRKTTRSRYRQWLTHKLATWIDQFGTSGCVGCGRCITWCPVGIDLTEEIAAIRGEEA